MITQTQLLCYDDHGYRRTHLPALAHERKLPGNVEGVYARVDTELPRFIAEIVGKTYTFQLKLGEFNFTSKHRTFTGGVEVPDAQLPGVSALASDVPADEKSNVAPQPSTSADPTAEGEPSTKQRFVPSESGSKKARSA
ncbi:hypothetical protein Bca101_068359 [Brassica carinata]